MHRQPRELGFCAHELLAESKNTLFVTHGQKYGAIFKCLKTPPRTLVEGQMSSRPEDLHIVCNFQVVSLIPFG